MKFLRWNGYPMSNTDWMEVEENKFWDSKRYRKRKRRKYGMRMDGRSIFVIAKPRQSKRRKK